LAFSYWIDNLGFITEGKLAAIFIKSSLGVSNWSVIYIMNYTPAKHHKFLVPLPRTEEEESPTSRPRHHRIASGADSGHQRWAILFRIVLR
jgi:hypothetical protein